MGRAAGENGSATYMEEEFDHRPTEDEIRSTVITWHNRETDKDILSGFTYENVPVWLSSENQNYSQGSLRPCRANSRGDSSGRVQIRERTPEPVYREFATLEDLTDFYTKAMQHIQNTLADGWKRKMYLICRYMR